MKLYYDRKSKDPTYFIQIGFRNGKKTSTKNVERIGRHSELLAQGISDPIDYARKIVADRNEKLKNARVKMEVNINFDEKIKATEALASLSTTKNVGYFFLQAVYNDLRIGEFFKNISGDRKISYDPDTVNRFLTYARILDPASKLGTCNHLGRYYEEPDIAYQHILRTMDLLASHYDDYISHLFKNSSRVVKRNTSICYFDCTNYYFETETQDPDYVDEVTGEIIKGFRRYGHSKQHQPSPLVEMGLFMDANGIPLSMCIAPGSDNEQTLAIPQEKKLVQMFEGKKFIYCADAGLGSLDIRNFNSMGGRAFIITQSIKKLSGPLKEAVFNDADYRLLSNGSAVSIKQMKDFDRFAAENGALYNDKAFKIIRADHAYDTGLTEEVVQSNGRKRKVKSRAIIPQRIIITFSRKSMEYQRHIRNNQIERAKNILKNMDPESYKKGPNDVTRFIKRKKGEDKKNSYEIDQALIEEEEKYDGFYAIATNLDDPASEILGINDQRYKIEECFRIMKTNFSARPIYHHTRERITAHFMICYTALLIYRLLEKKVDGYCQSIKEKKLHFTTQNIVETLRNMEVADVEGVYYMSTYTGSQVLCALNAAYDLKLDRKYYLPKELNGKIKKLI